MVDPPSREATARPAFVKLRHGKQEGRDQRSDVRDRKSDVRHLYGVESSDPAYADRPSSRSRGATASQEAMADRSEIRDQRSEIGSRTSDVRASFNEYFGKLAW